MNYDYDVTSFLKQRSKYGIQPGLDRIRLLLEKLNNPQEEIKGIHIAGTNGKGSTAHFLQKSLIALNYNVGMFTSPSFSSFRGHIFLNEQMISEKDFHRLALKIIPIVIKLDQKQIHLTEFEIITAIAFLYFKEHSDFVIIEAGMGGKNDTTNCFNPFISIITNVSFDHINFFGNQLDKIAEEKAGIIKYKTPVILGPSSNIVKEIIEKKAVKEKASLFMYGNEFKVSNYDLKKQRFTYKSSKRDSHFKISLVGKHQMLNASLAIFCLELLEKTIPIDWFKIKKAFEQITLPARFEKITLDQNFYLDGAHNEAGIEQLLMTLKTIFKNKKIEILFSGLRDKKLEKILKEIKSSFHEITLTTFEHPRALNKNEAKDLASLYKINFQDEWTSWIDKRLFNSSEKVYIITGSLYFVMQVRERLFELKNKR